MTQHEFQLAGGHLVRSGNTRLGFLAGMAGLAATLTLYTSGRIDNSILLQGIVFCLVGPVPFIFAQWLYGKGVVIVRADGIEFRSIFLRLLLAWEHIVSVKGKLTGPDNLMQRLLAGGHRQYVEVKLSRSPRRALLDNRAGTAIRGLPLLGTKTHRYHVQDPEGFLRAAEPFLKNPSMSGHRRSA